MKTNYLLDLFLIISFFLNIVQCGKGKEVGIPSLRSTPSFKNLNKLSTSKKDKKRNEMILSHLKRSTFSEENLRAITTFKSDLKLKFESFYEKLEKEILKEHSDSMVDEIELFKKSLESETHFLQIDRKLTIYGVFYTLHQLYSGCYDIKLYLEQVYKKYFTPVNDLLENMISTLNENRGSTNLNIDYLLYQSTVIIRETLMDDIDFIYSEISNSWVRNIDDLKSIIKNKIHNNIYTIPDELVVKIIDNLFFYNNAPTIFEYLVSFITPDQVLTLRNLIYKIIISWAIRRRIDEWKSSGFKERLLKYHLERISHNPTSYIM